MSQESVGDWEVETTEEDYSHEPTPVLEFEILNYPADTTLKGYKDQSDDGLLVVPRFQRRFVWDQVKASKLIESFLIGLPVPGVFLYKPRTGKGFQVIDGHQRITAVVSFLKGKINDKPFALKGVSKRWEGKTFEKLSDDERFKLEQSVMRATIIQQLDPHDDSSIFLIFERLNTGGVNLNPMEVRRCVYSGDIIDALDTANRNKNWRDCLGTETIDKRYRDVELILRVLALYENGSNYEKPMKGFLSDYLAKNKSLTMESAQIVSFLKACDAVVAAAGSKPFHLRGKLNYAALDSILVAIMRNDSRPTREQFLELVADPDFDSATTNNTSDKSEVLKRIERAVKVLG